MSENDSNTTTRMTRYIREDELEDTKETPQIEKEEKDAPKSLSSFKKIIIILFLIILAIIIYANTLGKSIIDIKEYKVESSYLPESFHGMKIVQFSDIHYGTTINKKQLDKIVNKINDLKPDIIIFTGDLIDKSININEDIENEIKDSLSNLNSSSYKYAIYGDEDTNYKAYEETMTNLGFTILKDKSTLLYYKSSTPIMISGLDVMINNPNYTMLTNTIEELDPSTLFKITLIHEPDAIDEISLYNSNLVLAGHSMGGLIKLPFIKPLFLPKDSKNYYKDYYHLNNTEFYISNGLGTSGINARLNNHPSINFYRLYKNKEVLTN